MQVLEGTMRVQEVMASILSLSILMIGFGHFLVNIGNYFLYPTFFNLHPIIFKMIILFFFKITCGLFFLKIFLEYNL